jgi:hypothetical protein
MIDKGAEIKRVEDDSDFDDVLWGIPAIAAFIKRSHSQTSYLIRAGMLDSAIRRLGRKTLIGSKRKLRQLFHEIGA